MADDKIIEKIKKLLALSNNNPNENEALAAALKAQELMAKYNIDLEQARDSVELREIAQEVYSQTGKHEMRKWKYGLSKIVADNFRCKVFCIGTDIVFYGYKEDAKIALQVFAYLYEVGNRLALRYYNKCRKESRPTKGVMNTYLMGFKKGISSVLEKGCTALMIITPQEVSDSFNELVKGCRPKKCKVSVNKNDEAYEVGKTDGKNVASARELEEKSA